MRKFYLLAVSCLFTFISFAQSINKAVASGSWSLNSTWSLNRVPVNGDVLEIPKNITVQVFDNIKMTDATIIVNVYGTLEMKVGKLDLGTESIINVYEGGHLISYQSNASDQIKIGGVSKYTGAEGTLNGPILASKSTGVAPLGFSIIQPVVLPVKFIGFNLSRKAGEVLVQWSTAQEINAAVYNVQRSGDGANWMSIATVAAAGNTSQLTNYNYSDNTAPNATIYYRIKQVDLDGKATFTPVKIVAPMANAAEVAITATQNRIAVQFSQQVKGRVELQVVALNGQVIAKQVVNEPVGHVVLTPAASLKGAYVVVVKTSSTQTARQVVL